ncbi:MAG TPA: LysR family transcriptional regulator [Polyangiaceae bacterium]|nr:LysR family transcriptional regulator [Polyangiaceae bacterium]
MRNIAALDLNLLVVLEALLAERSVTRAARRIGLSQPAVSNALGRLRLLLDDPLLVRTSRGMEPTPRALDLAAPIAQALDTIRRALSVGDAFDPQRSPFTFRIQSADNLELSLLPRLIEQLQRSAPQVDLVVSRGGERADEELRSGRIDLYLGSWQSVPSGFKQHLLRQETFACIARRGHPKIKSKLSLETYLRVGHVLVSADARPGGASDTQWSDHAMGRHVVLRTPSSLIAPLVVACTDLVATLPRGVASAFAEFLPLNVFKPPLDTPAFPIHMIWHPRTHEQAPHRWLREQIMQVSSDDERW